MNSESSATRYITELLDIQFQKSHDLQHFIKNATVEIERNFLSDPIPFYRWSVLSWNFVDRSFQTENFKIFWLLKDSIDEEEFLQLSKPEVEKLDKNPSFRRGAVNL